MTNQVCVQCKESFQTKSKRQKRCNECTEDNRAQSAESRLTKREKIAAMAMQGLLGNSKIYEHACADGLSYQKAMRAVVQRSVDYADALLAELRKESANE